ncbi:MAG: helix-turn-helix domain-containing protein [bacterium]|nr:helix-turn-helix domain-containing protein [bacterium]
MDIHNTLAKLDLSEHQSAVYFALLQMGSGSIMDVAKRSGLKRTTTYSILDGLVQKGFASVNKKNAHREYIAEDPRRLPEILNIEIQKIKQRQENFSNALPELMSFYNASAVKPKIKYFEGVEGMRMVFNETLQLGKDEEILAYSSAESIHKYLGDDYVKSYLAERVSKGIIQRAIAEDSVDARQHQKNDRKELRITRLVDKKMFPFANEINIFRNKMIIMSYADLLGVMIESEGIAKTQKSIFELSWLGAEVVNKVK